MRQLETAEGDFLLLKHCRRRLSKVDVGERVLVDTASKLMRSRISMLLVSSGGHVADQNAGVLICVLSGVNQPFQDCYYAVSRRTFVSGGESGRLIRYVFGG